MGTCDEPKDEATIMYKIKAVQFLGRSVPIILQNDNGPCPLLAICNVLLLRNNITLTSDMTEISLQRLLSLVAERLLDSNSNIENKDEEYVWNQQQNIADAIELLPRLATGLDVNVRFRNIHDFEFTPECAVFDLLDIGLVHGWIFDPQDDAACNVIGGNSYNTLVEKLVEVHISKADLLPSASCIEDSVDFAAATTATLGVPSPSLEILARTKSMEEKGEMECRGRKGDEEEAVQLQHALQTSKNELLSSTSQLPVSNHLSFCSVLYEGADSEDGSRVADAPSLMEPIGSIDNEMNVERNNVLPVLVASSSSVVSDFTMPSNDVQGESRSLVRGEFDVDDESFVEAVSQEAQVDPYLLICENSVKHVERLLVLENETAMIMQSPDVKSSQSSDGSDLVEDMGQESLKVTTFNMISTLATSPAYVEGLNVQPLEGKSLGFDTPMIFKRSDVAAEAQAAISEQIYKEGESAILEKEILLRENGGASYANDAEGVGSSSPHNNEPLYEGESILMDSTSRFESRGSLNEGEIIYTEHMDRGELVDDNVSTSQSSSGKLKPETLEECASNTVTEGMIIENFLSSNASQLTYYGLFCLQEGLKERELCVFFRNNHFSTMFKYNGDLYLLVTDQGYLNQPDLVWEKLHEVHGDSVFVTGSFSVFQVDQSSSLWDEQKALIATADYIASHKTSDPEADRDISCPSYHSDLQLAMALQQQELEQQQQQQQ
eukprot:c21062_g1_i1 orf=1-2163(-)